MNCAEHEDYLKLLEENKRLQQALSMSQEYAEELLEANARLTERNSMLDGEIECHVETISQYKEEKQKAEARNAELEKINTVIQMSLSQVIINENDRLKAENAKLREALDEIAHPLKYLQKEAEENGCSLNGLAFAVCNDANYLKHIAEQALAELSGKELEGE